MRPDGARRLEWESDHLADAGFGNAAGGAPVCARGRVVGDGEVAGPVFFFFAGIERRKKNDAVWKRFGIGRESGIVGEENDVVDEEFEFRSLGGTASEHFEVIHA